MLESARREIRNGRSTSRRAGSSLFAVVLFLASCSSPGTNAPSEAPGSPTDASQPTASAGLASPSPASTPSSTPEASAGPPRVALDDRLEAEIGVIGADFPVAAYDAVWVVAADQPEPAIERIDPETNEVVATILVPGRRCNGAVAAFDAVWACSGEGLVRIDPATNEVVSVIPFPVTDAQTRLAAGAGSVWALAGTGSVPDSVVRIDPATNTVSATIPLGHQGSALVFGFDALWVTSTPDDVLLRVDPTSNAVEVVAEGLEAAAWIAAGEGSVWVTLHGDLDVAPPDEGPTLVRIDPESLEVQAEIDAGPITAGGIFAGEGSVWLRSADQFLSRLDPATNEVVEIIEATKGGGDVIVAYGSVWATSYDFGDVWRIRP